MDEILKDPLNVIKFNELKKKIKTTIVAGEKSSFLNDKKWFIFNNWNYVKRLNKNIKYYLE